MVGLMLVMCGSCVFSSVFYRFSCVVVEVILLSWLWMLVVLVFYRLLSDRCRL